jgi:dipeptidyl-peptidase-4
LLTAQDYARAERFLAPRANKLIFNTEIVPHWFEKSDRFWYVSETPNGKQFKLVEPESNTWRQAFDHSRLAAALSQAAGAKYLPNQLPFSAFEFGPREIRFDIRDAYWTCDLEEYECRVLSKAERISEDQLRSPDGYLIAFVKDHNIHVRSLSTGDEIALTRDGEQLYDYGSSPEANTHAVTDRLNNTKSTIAIWSPDSKKLVAHRLDQRNVAEVYLLQSALPSGSRARLHAFRFPLVGDKNVGSASLVILDLDVRTVTNATCEPAPVTYLTPIEFKLVWWSQDSQRVYFIHRERGDKRLRFYEVEASTGVARLVLEEESKTYLEPNLTSDEPFYGDIRPNVRVLGKGKEVIWFSERDGWGHLYLYDAVHGVLKRQLTSGHWVVRDIVHVEESQRKIYFTGGGREEGRDPYYRHLYRIYIDDCESQPELLTPENADHEIHFSPSGKYFVDTYSRVDTAPVTVLRTSDGKLVRELERANVEPLLSAGWKWPEPFIVKARDGLTDLYGVIYRPSNFDPSRKYPVLDDIYPGPQIIRTPKSFDHEPMGSSSWFWHPQAIAELGFIVITIDGMGTPYRSKRFHDVSYGNLEDAGGLVDHIVGLKQLATRFPYMDLDRVGIYGHSAGGYASVRAILLYPDFYKVAVSSAGDHDLRGNIAEWGEKYQGPPQVENYERQANAPLAPNLKGKLLLAFGDMDDNVPPALTIQLIDALIKANKDFDVVLMPNRNHQFSNDLYFIRRRWNYFVKHLLGSEPVTA